MLKVAYINYKVGRIWVLLWTVVRNISILIPDFKFSYGYEFTTGSTLTTIMAQ